MLQSREMQTGEVIDSTYQIMQKIGSGGTGDVYLAYHSRLQKYVVIKKIKDGFTGQMNIRAEVDILKSLKHTCLPQVYDFVQRGQQVYTVMDYIEGYDLDSYIRSGCRAEEDTLLKWLKQLCEVLVYLHSQKPPIIHSDIKPANIMVTKDGNICLIDFNISLDGDDSSQISGISLPYASPEQYAKAVLFGSGREHRHIVLDGRTDMYSLGASFYHLMAGAPPAKPYERTLPLGRQKLDYGNGLIYVIDKAMMPDISDRYESMEQMQKAVNSLYKSTKAYKLYLISVIGAALLYVTVMGLGLSCLIYGMNLGVREEYEENRQRLFDSYDAGDYEKTINEGYEILNNRRYQSILEKNKTDYILIFHAVGEAYFEYGDYENAAVWYGRAAEYISDIRGYSDYYRDYIVALVRAGYEEAAREELLTAQEQGIESIHIDLVNAELLVYNRDYSEAMNEIERLAKLNIDGKTKMHLLVLGGEAAEQTGDYEKQIDYLERAKEEDAAAGVLRKLGNAYMNAALKLRLREKDKNTYYQQAMLCYEELSKKSYTSLNDYLNLAICRRALGNYKDSIQLLKELEASYSDYRIFMHLAFAYDKIGDGEHAKKYVRSCLTLYDKTPEGEKESLGSDNMQSLKELEKKYR